MNPPLGRLVTRAAPEPTLEGRAEDRIEQHPNHSDRGRRDPEPQALAGHPAHGPNETSPHDPARCSKPRDPAARPRLYRRSPKNIPRWPPAPSPKRCSPGICPRRRQHDRHQPNPNARHPKLPKRPHRRDPAIGHHLPPAPPPDIHLLPAECRVPSAECRASSAECRGKCPKHGAAGPTSGPEHQRPDHRRGKSAPPTQRSGPPRHERNGCGHQNRQAEGHPANLTPLGVAHLRP